MNVTGIIIAGENTEITIRQSNTDIHIEQQTPMGIPYDADDAVVWEFCLAILYKIDGPEHFGPLQSRIAEIYSTIKCLIETASEYDDDSSEQE